MTVDDKLSELSKKHDAEIGESTSRPEFRRFR
jgi:hypothetical protein